ncbi:MAG: hypothetical protein ACI9J3_003858 [Parvicellaceae bacterium]|jgi:hypothetical protein
MGFIEEIKKPFNIVMLILAIASVLFTTIFYFMSIKKTEFSYSIEATTKIIDSKLTGPKIRVFSDNNNEITSDIYSSSIILWNSGDYPINNDDIRVRPSIIISGISELISNPTTKESHPLVTKFKLHKDTIEENKFNLNWKYFDPQKAVRINFLYTAKDDNSFDIEIEGNILGVEEFHRVEIEPYKNKKSYIIIMISLIALLIIISTYALIRFRRTSSRKYFYIINLVMAILMLFFVIYMGFFYSIKTPIF